MGINIILFSAVWKLMLKTEDRWSVCEANEQKWSIINAEKLWIQKPLSLYGRLALPEMEQKSQIIIASRGLKDWHCYPSLFLSLRENWEDFFLPSIQVDKGSQNQWKQKHSLHKWFPTTPSGVHFHLWKLFLVHGMPLLQIF